MAHTPEPPSLGPPGVRPWLRRYLVLDLAGLVGGLVLGCAVHAWTGRVDAMTVAAILGENLGFYGMALARDLARARRADARGLAVVLRSLFLEFAAAECLDLLLVRPGLIVVVTRMSGSAAVGIALGGTLADVAYYSVAGGSARFHSRGSRRDGTREPA